MCFGSHETAQKKASHKQWATTNGNSKGVTIFPTHTSHRTVIIHIGINPRRDMKHFISTDVIHQKAYEQFDNYTYLLITQRYIDNCDNYYHHYDRHHHEIFRQMRNMKII